MPLTCTLLYTPPKTITAPKRSGKKSRQAPTTTAEPSSACRRCVTLPLVAIYLLPRAAARSAPINSLNSQVKRAHGKRGWFGTLPAAFATARQRPATCDTTYCQTVPRESRDRFASCVGQPNQARNDRFSTTRQAVPPAMPIFR